MSLTPPPPLPPPTKQGDFHQWTPFLNRLDDYYDVAVKPRADLALLCGDAPPDAEPGAPPPPADPPLPSRTLLACLRATAAILENCPNKHLYQSYEVRGEREREEERRGSF